MGAGRNDGAVVDYSEPGSIEGRLTDFDIGSADLLFMHRRWLETNVVPVLEGVGSIAITGLTSRSGSAAYNLGLSERRARRVLGYLRGKVGGSVAYSLDPAYAVKSVMGAGEALAEQAGQRDGREDPFYRAVIVLAWYKPTPPPAPTPKPKPDAPTIKRVTSRKLHKFTSRMPGEPGEAGMEWADIVRDVIGLPDGGSEPRTYAMVPADHVVTHVREEFIVNNQVGMGVITTSYDLTIEYRWGPDTGTVFLSKRQKRIESGKEFDWKQVDLGHYSRREVWKHTIAPDRAISL